MLSSLVAIPVIFGSYSQVVNTYDYVMTTNLSQSNISFINNGLMSDKFEYNSLIFKNDLSYYIEFYSDNYDYINITQYSYISDSPQHVSFDFAKDLYTLGQLPLFDYNVSSFNVNDIISGDGISINSFNVFNFDLNTFKQNNFSEAWLFYGFEISYSNGSNSLEIYDMTYSNSSFALGYSSIPNYEYDNAYSNGYSNGYSAGVSEGYTNGYNYGYDSRQSTIDNLQIQVDNLTDLVNDYREGRISLESLMWTIASLPFESFKQIWNVDLLGVNLGGFALGLMFVGIVLFIWKKFI